MKLFDFIQRQRRYRQIRDMRNTINVQRDAVKRLKEISPETLYTTSRLAVNERLLARMYAQISELMADYRSRYPKKKLVKK